MSVLTSGCAESNQKEEAGLSEKLLKGELKLHSTAAASLFGPNLIIQINSVIASRVKEYVEQELGCEVCSHC